MQGPGRSPELSLGGDQSHPPPLQLADRMGLKKLAIDNEGSNPTLSTDGWGLAPKVPRPQ